MSNDLDEAYEELHGTFGNTAPVLRRVLATVLDHLRSHPAPPPSPSEENGGEGAGSRGFDAMPDQDVTEAWVLEVNFDGYGYRPDALFATEALANEALAKFRGGGIANARVMRWTAEASADAATVAALRRVKELVEHWRKDSSADSSWKVLSAIAVVTDSLRPEPGGGK